jgi:hypothetical protein
MFAVTSVFDFYFILLSKLLGGVMLPGVKKFLIIENFNFLDTPLADNISTFARAGCLFLVASRI